MAIESITQSPAIRSGRTLGEFAEYDEAQNLVDALSDREYPVRELAIIGKDLEYREQVTGRLTTKQAGLQGLVWGLFAGGVFALVVGLGFTGLSFVGVLAFGLLVGGLSGAASGALYQVARGGRRGFTSSSGIRARTYVVQAASMARAAQAERALHRDGTSSSAVL